MSTRVLKGIAMAAIAGAIALPLTAGGSDAGGSGGAKKPKLGMLLALTGIPFSSATSDGAKDGAKAVNASLTIAGPPSIDPTTAIKQFTDMTATKPDGVVIFPIPADLWVRPLSQAAGRGILLDAIHVPPASG